MSSPEAVLPTHILAHAGFRSVQANTEQVHTFSDGFDTLHHLFRQGILRKLKTPYISPLYQPAAQTL
jgi:hypothetical protein